MNYDIKLIAKRLAELRKQNNNLSLKKLSDGIKKRTGVQISHTQLSKYENIDNPDIMNIINFAAIADYYNVSYDYLLGYSESKVREFDSIEKQTGLSDKAIYKLKSWRDSFSTQNDDGVRTSRFKTTKAPKEINELIENDKFKKFIYYIRALKYISDNETINENNEILENYVLTRGTIDKLRRGHGKNQARKMILFFIQELFKEMINEIVPYTPSDDDEEGMELDIDDIFD